MDVAITTNRVSIADIAIDKTYMIQLVEVQRKRGATGGNIFANAIKVLDPDSPGQDSPVSVKIPKPGRTLHGFSEIKFFTLKRRNYF